MPAEQQYQQPQSRPALGAQRSTGSIHSQTTSPSNTPPQHGKPKAQKHVVGGGRMHARVPSSKGMHKLTKAHGVEGSHENLKKLGRNSSATVLKKNNSHVSLKRNQSSTDVSKRPKSSHNQDKRPASVHFQIGDQQDDGWEEASSSASPALSRSVSRPNSAKQSASNSEPQSPQSPNFKSHPPAVNGLNEKPSSAREHASADAKVITERLLQRTLSHNTTKMSLANATSATTSITTGTHSSDSLGKSHISSNASGTPKVGSKDEVVSRFVTGSGTPSDGHHFLQSNRKLEPKAAQEDIKRAQSMGNLTRRDSEEEDERALAPRSRKSSTSNSAYNPPQQSRTQQKLWLQRASSNIEPQQMAPGVAINGLSNLHNGMNMGMGASPLLGAGYDGRDPRIKQQLERTGLEYLVVRRHQDPVELALKRLNQLPGANRNRRIPSQYQHQHKKSDTGGGARYGLSQSLKDARRKEGNAASTGAGKNGGGEGGKGAAAATTASALRSSFEGQQQQQQHTGSHDESSTSMSGRRQDNDNGDDDGISATLRSLWEKSFDFASSAE